jgi:hypothetical protein
MTKEELKAKLLLLESDAAALLERSQIELKTCQFLEARATELLTQYRLSTSETEKAELNEKMAGLKKRFDYEMSIFTKDVEKKNDLATRLNELETQIKE